MTSMRKTILKLLAGSFLCALIMILPPAPSRAAVDFTRDGAADYSGLYVAGVPDGYPVESFDEESGEYIGAGPTFLSLVSEKTGLDFYYIRAGGDDRRESLAKNDQVDLMFATGDENKVIDLGVEKLKLFSLSKNGSPTDVYCVFTSVSSEAERTKVRSVAESLTKDDVARLLTTEVSQSGGLKDFSITLLVLGGALFCAIAVIVPVLCMIFKRRPKKQTFSDPLTGLGNRARFAQMFSTDISDQTRELYNIAYFAFDIAWVNNNYGNEEADAVLRYAAHTVTKYVKDNEFCARVGGGAFAAAFNVGGDVPVEKRVESIVKKLNEYGGKNPGSEGKLLFQAGICALTLEDKDAEKVLYNAQQAYRRAVEEKKEYVFVNRDVLKDYRLKAFIRETARDALEKRTFTPYVQFVVYAENGMICGGEILSRWETRAFGLLSPGRYIQILQDIGLIVRHDLYMMEEACRLLEKWHSEGKNYFLNCNLTRVTISDPTLVEQVLSLAERYKFPKEKLILEVTEDSLESDKENALKNVRRLKENGFHIALDDFSSGYTTVTNLYEYAVDIVKIDRQMVLASEHDSQAASVMKEITRLCHELQVSVLAEGVETEEQARRVRSIQCDYIQGYFYARALPIRELEGFEQNYKAKVISAPAESAENLIVAPVDTVPKDDPVRLAIETPVVHAAPEVSEKAAQAAPVTPAPVADAEPIRYETPAPVAEAEPIRYETPAPVAEAASVRYETPAPVANEAPVRYETPSAPAAPAFAEQAAPVSAVSAAPAAFSAAPAAERTAERADSAQNVSPVSEKTAEKPKVNSESAAEKNMLHIQYGPFRLDLPGNIDINPVGEILKAIQDKLD